MRLLGGVFDDGLSFCQTGRQHDVHGSAHAGNIQINIGAGEPLGSVGTDDAVADIHFGAQRLKALHVLVDGADAAEVAAAGHGYLRPVEPAQKRADQIIAGPHSPVQVAGGHRAFQPPAVNLNSVGGDHPHAAAQLPQDLHLDEHVADHGDVFDPAHAVYHNGRRNDGHRRVFRAADRHLAKQRFPAVNHKFIQRGVLLVRFFKIRRISAFFQS